MEDLNIMGVFLRTTRFFHQPESEKNHQLILRFWLNLVIDAETIKIDNATK